MHPKGKNVKLWLQNLVTERVFWICVKGFLVITTSIVQQLEVLADFKNIHTYIFY